MKDYFSYTSTIEGMPKDKFRISPSQISRFFDDSTNWWRDQVLGEEPVFKGSTASELGNCVHAAAHMYFDTKQVDTSAIDKYISAITDAEIDKTIIRSQYKTMAETLINKYSTKYPISDAELFLWSEVDDKVLIGGSLDGYSKSRSTLVDYKTIGSLDTARVPKSFPRNYYFQQMAYAWLLRKHGYRVDYAELVYISRGNTGRVSETTGKPLKDYPSEVNIVRHQITEDDMTIIDNTIKLIAESVTAFKQYPEIAHIICKDYRLKPKPARILFKD